MVEYYVNLSLLDSQKAIGVTAGTSANPYNFVQLLDSLSADYNDDVTYYTRGSCVKTLSAYDATNEGIFKIGGGAVTEEFNIVPWDIDVYGPWMIKFTDIVKFKHDYAKINFKQGWFECLSIKFQEMNGDNPFTNVNYYSTFKSVHINVLGDDTNPNDTIQVADGTKYKVKFFGCNIIIPSGYSFSIDTDQRQLFQNTIVDIKSVYCLNPGVNTTWFEFDECSIVSAISALEDQNIALGGNDNGTLLFYNYNSKEWPEITWPTFNTISAMDVSAAKENFNYIKSDFDNLVSGSYIKAVGNQYEKLGLYNNVRDGVGSLYFEPFNFSSFSGSPTSGQAPLLTTFTVDSTSANDSVIRSILVNNVEVSSFNIDQNSVEYTFLEDGISSTSISATSKYGWITEISAGSTLNIATISATIDLVDAINLQQITSAYIYQDLYVSATQQKNVDRFEIDYGDVTTLSGNGPLTQYLKDYNTSGSYVIILSAYNIFNNVNITSASLDIYYRDILQYYVNINSSYDASATPHLGTSADPYNMDEFYDQVSPGTFAIDTNHYKIKGLRTIQPSDSYYDFEVDHNKQFIFDCWDEISATNYGPWIMVFNDNSNLSANNHNLNFKGTSLRNGIIYNLPYFKNGLYTGGKNKIHETYNMWINENNGLIAIGASTSADGQLYAKIAGSNIFSQNGYVGEETSAYNFYIKDSLMSNFIVSNSATFSAATVNIDNSLFDQTLTSVSSTFNIGLNRNSQYEFSFPVTYPFKVNQFGYNSTLTDILQNKSSLIPFSNINVSGTEDYTNYNTGIFGYDRTGIGSFSFAPINTIITVTPFEIDLSINTFIVTEPIIVSTIPIEMRLGIYYGHGVTTTDDYEIIFSASPIKGLNPLTVMFTDLTQINVPGFEVSSRHWSFGDGTSAITTDETIYHTYVGKYGQVFNVGLSVTVQATS